MYKPSIFEDAKTRKIRNMYEKGYIALEKDVSFRSKKTGKMVHITKTIFVKN